MTLMEKVNGEWREISDEEHRARILAEAAAEGIDLCPRCFYGNRIDGTDMCRGCARDAVFNADPDFRAWSDAQDRLDFGEWAPDSTRPYTHDDAKVDEALIKRLSAKFNWAERAATIDPNGCALCGVSERYHGQRWHDGQPFSAPRVYVAPSNDLRKARMTARRNVRNGRPAWAPLDLVGAA